MYKVDQGNYKKRVQQVAAGRSENSNRDSHYRNCQKQNAKKFYERNDRFYRSNSTDENKSFIANSSRQTGDLKETVEKKTAFKASSNETRTETFGSIAEKSSNKNEDSLQNKGSLVKRTKTGKSTELPEIANKQGTIKNDKSNEIICTDDLHNHDQVLEERENATGITNSCHFNVESNDSFNSSPTRSVYYLENVYFKTFRLQELLCYNVDLMQYEQLYDYAYALKTRVLEILFALTDDVRDELEFLCAITDGTQTEKNQKLITRRMYLKVSSALNESQEISKLLSTYNSERSVPQQTWDTEINEMNSDFISSTEKNTQCNEDENVNLVLHRNLDTCQENTKKSNSNVNGDFANDSWETSHVTETNSGNNEARFTSTNSFCNNRLSVCDDVYDNFELENLLKYDAENMHGSTLFSYAFALKKKILEHISEFHEFFREKLEFTCKITDGTQTEKNQRLIVNRMCLLIKESFQRYGQSSNR